MLREMLLSYSALNPTRASVAVQFLALMDQHHNFLLRSCHPGHITGSAWVLNPSHDRALLLYHRKLSRWLQPGGHADGDPDILRVAQREVQEESGLTTTPLLTDIFDLDIHEIPARGDEPAHLHYDVRFLLVATSDDVCISNESNDWRWIALSDIDSLITEESIRRMAAASAAFVRYNDHAY